MLFTVFLLCLLSAASLFAESTDFASLNAGKVRINSPVTGRPVEFKGIHYPLLGAPDEEAYSYYGIRYGKAERFQHSELNDDFSYLEDPKRPLQGNVCPMIFSVVPGGLPPVTKSMSEDCLYMDIYVPPVSKSRTELFPVFLYMHGGGFIRGDKDVYNGTFLAADIRAVVVTINYRHGVFGFLSTKTEVASGNWGIGDAKLALQWTRRYITAFGGDPNRITISGQSAGGIMTSLLFLDKQVRQSVQAAIAMSGSAFTPYAMADYKAVEMTLSEARETGCGDQNDLQEAVECLKKLPLEKLIYGRNITTHYLDETRFSPVIDGVHIVSDPADMIKNSKLAGDETEGTYVIGYTKDEGAQYEPTVTDASAFDVPKLREEIATLFPAMRDCPEEPSHQQLIDDVLKFYAVNDSMDRSDLLKILQIMFTDLWLKYPTNKESSSYSMRAHTKRTPNYQYLISYGTKFMGMGAFHGIDVNLLFRGIGFELVPKDSYSWQALVSMKDFVKTVVHNGRPAGSSFADGQPMLHLNADGAWDTAPAVPSSLLSLWERVYAYQCPNVTQHSSTQQSTLPIVPKGTTVDPNNAAANRLTNWWNTVALLMSYYFL